MNSIRKPNFFIVGAPKCGTTSLWAWLNDHPNVFMSPTKEPHYFNTDHKQGVTSLNKYEALFAAARKEHTAIGEASTWYLASEEAAQNILDYNPDARFIVMVRNPIQMARAVHGQNLLNGYEWVSDFTKAWNLQDARRRGDGAWAMDWVRWYLMYGEICSLGHQLERLLSIVPRERVLTITMDDLQADPRQEYLRTLKFLEVDDDGRSEFPTYNSASTLRWPCLMHGLLYLKDIKDRLHLDIHTGFWDRVDRINRVRKPRSPVSPQLEASLKEYFAPDIVLLSALLSKDLSSWFIGSL